MPRLVDTTIRVLSQEPLAGLMPTADLLRLAELLDGAGFAYLEVSGGGVFDNAVRRGVESPWERIRALKARTKTPLALAVRGRFSARGGSRRRRRDRDRRLPGCADDAPRLGGGGGAGAQRSRHLDGHRHGSPLGGGRPRRRAHR